MSFIDLLKRESVCDQIRHRKSDCFCSLEEIKCCSIISQCVYPGTNQVDFFGAEIEVRVDCSISTFDEETKFAKTAAVTDEFVDVCMCVRVTCALECKVGKMSALSFFNSFCKSFDSLVLCEVYGYFSAHLLSEFKSF